MIRKLFSTIVLVAVLFSSLPCTAAFATKSFTDSAPSTYSGSRSQRSAPVSPFSTQFTTTSQSTTTLAMSNDKEEPYDTGYVDGSTTGAFLMAFVLLINVWIFSIPTEFRRARICKEEDVALYPNKNCITANEWMRGVGDYYKNGGGVQFDFSIEGK